MNRFISVIILSLFLPVHLLAHDNDTTIQGVTIEFNYSVSIFPDSWREGAINGQGENILPEEISRTKSAIITALKKYPDSVLTTNLKAIYCLKSMKFYNVGFGGTNSTEEVYITNDGVASGYTNEYIEQTFHHEFSSVLLRNYISLMDTTAWKNANIPGFDYNDPEEGVGAIRNKQSSQEIDTVLCRKGFLTQYAYSSMENDVNTIAQNLFRPAPGFWDMVGSYPRIRGKVTLLIKFYHGISAAFTEIYFRKFENQIR
jgi:hypothetical protein